MKVAGIEYQINWRAFKKGRALFFPCLDTAAAKAELDVVFKRLGLNVVYKSVIDTKSGIRGLRVWRI